MTGHTRAVMSLVFTPDSKRLISSGARKAEIRFWERFPAARNRAHPATSGPVRPKVIAKGGSNYIATDPAGKTMFVWNPPPRNDVRGVHRIDVIDYANSAFLYDIKESGRIVKSLVVSPNGKVAATGGADGSVRLWEIKADAATPMPGGDWFLFDKVASATSRFPATTPS